LLVVVSTNGDRNSKYLNGSSSNDDDVVKSNIIKKYYTTDNGYNRMAIIIPRSIALCRGMKVICSEQEHAARSREMPTRQGRPPVLALEKKGLFGTFGNWTSDLAKFFIVIWQTKIAISLNNSIYKVQVEVLQIRTST
jgi:hypothetical protein